MSHIITLTVSKWGDKFVVTKGDDKANPVAFADTLIDAGKAMASELGDLDVAVRQAVAASKAVEKAAAAESAATAKAHAAYRDARDAAMKATAEATSARREAIAELPAALQSLVKRS